MKRLKAKIAVTLLISVQLLALVIWLVVPKFGSGPPGGAYAYRAEPRMSALSEWHSHPSPETKAAWEDELHLLERYKLARILLKATVVVALNTTIIYLFWNHGCKQVDRPD
ncbi:MAG: hypothetical protein QOD99_2500 [Chthoniobacter sp.]|nr:hypothetical protein [Chthoniobacter sp.]